MAETAFYLSSETQIKLLACLIETGLVLVPDVTLIEPRCPVVSVAECAVQWLPVTRHFFAVQPIDVSRLQIDRFDDGPKEGGYFIMPRSGAPAISFFCSHIVPPRSVAQGSIGYYPDYWSPTQGRTEKVPDGLRKVYRDAAKFIRSVAVPTEWGRFRDRALPAEVEMIGDSIRGAPSGDGQ